MHAGQLLFVAGRRGCRPSPPFEGIERAEFPGSRSYWERRYASGGNSGAGSYGELARFKARVLNEVVTELGLLDAIEWGCGDGHQLTLLRIASCTGVDVSESALARCRERFVDDASRRFMPVVAAAGLRADLSMSLDVLYHLVEDEVFDAYMRRLFESARRLVVVYSSNHDSTDTGAPHVRHRRFTDWVDRHATGWRLWRHLPNPYPWGDDVRAGSFADFYLFRPLQDGHDGDMTWQTAGSTTT